MRWLIACLVSGSLVAQAAPRPKPARSAAQSRAAAAEEQAARGDAWAVAGRCDEAVKAYREAVKLDERNAVVKVRLAHCLARSGGEAEARALLESVVTAPDPAGALALTELGDLAQAAGNLQGAVDAYDRLVARDPHNVEAKLALLEALVALAQSQAAGRALARTRALDLAGKLKLDARADATARRRAEELEATVQYGDAGRDLLDARARLGAGDGKGALALLERVVAAHPELEEAEYLLGLAYSSPDVARRSDARAAFRKAPHQKEAQAQLGIDAYEGGELDEAQKRLEAAIEIDHDYQAAWYQLGLVAHERGDAGLAKRAWSRAAGIDPRSELGRWASTKLALLTGNVNALAEGQVIDPSSEIGIGQALGKQVVERFGKLEDPPLEERLDKILLKLANVSDRPVREMRYRVVLVDVPMINALTLPGGTVLVFRGLVDLVKNQLGNSDDAWASVLGHECAHAALRHGMGMIQVASSLATERPFAGGAGDLSALLNTVSRAHEFEADQFGVLYAYRAGFNPVVSVALHEKMLQQMGEIPRGMTHPTHKERIARVRDYLLDLRAKVRGFDLAVKALGEGDYDAAEARLEVFLGVFPDSTAARSNLGVALHRKALTALEPSTRFRRATDVDPNSRARKIELRAAGAQVKGLSEGPKLDERLLREAAGEYRAALALDPGYVKAQVNLGAALDDLKDRRGAREVLERAVRTAPGEKEAWNNLGAVAAETGDARRALEALQKAVELDRAYPEAWFNLGMAWEQAGKPAEAARAWDTYLALDGKSGWAEVARQHRGRIVLK